jgi:hypothetical protein
VGAETVGTADGTADGTAPSRLTSVVVHGRGAVCTRSAEVTLPQGGADGGDGGETVVVRVADLPPSLLDSSLRGRVAEGPGGLRVTDIRVEYAATLRRRDDLPRLRLDVEDAEDRQARARDRTKRLAAEIETVAAMRAEPPAPRRGDPPRWAPVESLLALANFVESRLGTLHERLREARAEEERADHELDVLLRRMATASTATDQHRAAPTATAVVTLARAEPGGEAQEGPVTLELEYQVPGARWAPVYQLRLDGRSDRGVLVMRAAVAQRTGENWNGVRLALSTADLLRRADLPEVRSLRIGRRQPERPRPSWREEPAGLEDLFAGYDGSVRAPRLAPGTRIGIAYAGGASAGEGQDEGGWADFEEYPELELPPPVPGPDGVPYGFPVGQAAPDLPAGAAPPPPPAPMAPASFAAPGGAPRAAARGGQRAAAPGTADAWAALPPSPAAVASAAAPPPPADERYVPRDDLLDYARLTLAGPDAPAGRGTLQPAPPEQHAVAAEYRRRAEVVKDLPLPAHAADVRESAGSFDHRFDAAAPVDVAANGGWHIVPVVEVPVGVEFGHVCAPCEDPAVFGTVRVANTSPHSLLPGPVDVMVDGDFVLTAPLPALAAGQRQTVGLGVTESVKAARTAHMRESTAGLRGGTTVLEHTVEITVGNRLPYPVVVRVRERVPVSHDKDVRVDEHEAVPPWTAATAPEPGQEELYVKGVRTWEVALEPGADATLTGGYTIRLPAGKAVVGGNRRN